MALTRSQAAATLSQIRQCVTAMWIFFNYQGCPREITQNNLILLDKEIGNCIREFNKHTELKSLLPSADAVLVSFQEMLCQVDFAADIFDLPSLELPLFVEQRGQFYRAYKDIFECIVRTKESLDGFSNTSDNLLATPATSSSSEVQAAATFAQLSERLARINAIFQYDLSPRDIVQSHLLSFEKELREILGTTVTSPEIQKGLRSAHALQSALREAILHLNFAADLFDLPLTPDQRRQFYLMYREICTCFLHIQDNLLWKK